MAISGVLAATFIFALALPLLYVILSFTRKTKPSFDSVYTLAANAAAIVTALRLLWLVFYDDTLELTDQDRFYLLVGAVAAAWYGGRGALKTFNKLFGIELRDEPKDS